MSRVSTIPNDAPAACHRVCDGDLPKNHVFQPARDSAGAAAAAACSTGAQTIGARSEAALRAANSEAILKLQDEMLYVASTILGEQTTTIGRRSLLLRVRRRLLKNWRKSTKRPAWSLDGDEEAEEGVFAEADIPREIERVRDLIDLVPEGTDRRFDTLMSAISVLCRQNPEERFVIFTQYRDTLEFLAEELGKCSAGAHGQDRWWSAGRQDRCDGIVLGSERGTLSYLHFGGWRRH